MVNLKEVKSILPNHRDLALSLSVWNQGNVMIEHFGLATDQALYEIGSLTKIFTALGVAKLHTDGKLDLHTPVCQLLPFLLLSENGQITIFDLVTHSGGIPRLPPNLRSTDPLQPYASYNLQDLKEDLIKGRLSRAIPGRYLYSNYGYAILGLALSEFLKEPVELFLVRDICKKLGLFETDFKCADSNINLIPGLNAHGETVSAWKLGLFNAAGGLKSTIKDMRKFIEIAYDPPEAFRAAVRLSQESTTTKFGTLNAAFGWLVDAQGVLQHNGATSGFSSAIIIDPKKKKGCLVLSNCYDKVPTLADRVAKILAQTIFFRG